MLEELREKVSLFPDLPGVYLLKDNRGRVIYVGKALSLRKRVRSYLADNDRLSPRVRSLQNKLARIDYLVTDTEVEALILECSLIKEYRPRYNVNLKDDKDYPYLILTPELYPRLELLRLSQKGSRRGRYRPEPGREERRFGPYTDVGAVRETMRLLGSLFPLRRCRRPLDGTPVSERPCLNFQMKRCAAPCRGEEAVSSADYGEITEQVILFLQGRYGELERDLKRAMTEAASVQRFEEAALLRDRLHSVERVAGRRQKMLTAENSIDRDVAALVRLEERAAVHLFQVRGGRLLRQEHFSLTGAAEVDDEEVMASFLKGYYNRKDDLPREIVLSAHPAESALIEQWLSEVAGRKVTLRLPQRGILKKLVNLAGRNGLLRLEEEVEQQKRAIVEPLQELARLLNLPLPPQRIEAYDISHLRGEETVGAMVVYYNGEPARSDYRTFNIRRAPAGDDYAALQEVLLRRASRFYPDDQSADDPSPGDPPPDDQPRPDLILIDGGRGQLQAVRRALADTPLASSPLVALAKDPDRVFLSASPRPLLLPAENGLLKLLQRIRDEVHRFAVSGHRRRRSAQLVRSRLEEIPGIGPARRTALLAHFGSVDAISRASEEELAALPGINSSLAALIHRSLSESFHSEAEDYVVTSPSPISHDDDDDNNEEEEEEKDHKLL